MPISMFGHPLGPRQMALMGAARAFRLTIWIDVQYDLRNFAPISAFGVGVEQPQIGDQVLFIVRRQRRIGRRDISDIWD